MIQDWTAQQLAEFVAAVSGVASEAAAVRIVVERAAEALEAEFGALLLQGAVAATVGFGRLVPSHEELLAAATTPHAKLEVPGLGASPVVAASIDTDGGWLLIARTDGDFATAELGLLRGMARVTRLTVDSLRARTRERERGQLLERLARIQRMISSGGELQEVLELICQGAVELLGDPIAGLRLIDPSNPDEIVLVAGEGIDAEAMEMLRRVPVGEGVGGKAVALDLLVIQEGYAESTAGLAYFRDKGLATAMAAPVHEHGLVVGSLTVAAYDPTRRFSVDEQEVLIALAEHASLALTDARLVEDMRQAQQSKDMFLAMVSHELKTPLTVIMGTLRTMQMHAARLGPERTSAMLEAAYERGRDLERLINRLLQGARADLASTPEDVHLPALVADSLDGFEQSRRLTLGPVPDLVVRVDSVAVRAVLGTLLENAVSHSPPGTGIDVTAVLDGEVVVLTVANTGALPADLDPVTLFQPFQRGSFARSSGVGLGLYIAARQAEGLGGRMSVVDDGSGTVRFTLRFPTSSQTPV